MATFNIPRTRVQYSDNTINEPYFSAYWGATVEGEYLSNPYRLRITSITVSGYIKCNSLPSGATGRVTPTSSLGLRVYSYNLNGSLVTSQYFTVSVTSQQAGTVQPGQTCSFTGRWTGSYDLSLASEGGRLRGLLFRNGNDYGMIYSTQTYPTDYVPVNPDISINVGSNNVNNVNVSLNSSILTDLSSYSYTFDLYSDAGRTNRVWTYTGSNINNFPLNWNSAAPGTNYYWKLNCSGTNSHTGGTVSMPEKTGTVTTQVPWVSEETLTWSASPLYNNHWTPRTVITYSISNHGTNEHSVGLSFYCFEIQTAINGLTSNTKTFRITNNDSSTQTLALNDTNKVLREVKPRDLFYMKVRVVCRDNANREYFSNWFGITTAQYIYNKFHVYLSRPSTNEQLRVNSKAQFNGRTNENYWNKGEVK